MKDSENKKVECNLTDSIAYVGRKKKTQYISMQINIQMKKLILVMKSALYPVITIKT